MAVEMDIERVRDMEPRERAEYDAQVEERVIRFGELRPEWMAYREAALPAHERALYGYVGSVAAENPAFRSSVLDGENFCFTIVRADPGKGAPLHAHTTEEVFMPLTGRWAIYWGEDGSRWVYLERWDAVSIPAPVMRGFWNASEEAAHLLAIQGSGSPPPPIYHPAVLEEVATPPRR
jgi:mannose-6-phosphate isomerase-like protein (cupin superfamily)